MLQICHVLHEMLPIFLLEEASALIRVKTLQMISGRVSSSVNWTFRVATKSESKSTWAQSPVSQKVRGICLIWMAIVPE